MYEMNGKKSDEELVTLSQKGDKQAMEELLIRHAGLVRGCARGFFLIGGETEDLIQEGMIAFHEAIGAYDESKGLSFKNFACLCVKRRIYDVIKRSTSGKMVPLHLCDPLAWFEDEAIGDPEEDVVQSESGEELMALIVKTLSSLELQAFMLYIKGYSLSEICEVVGRDAKSVDNALFRSKKKLQGALKGAQKQNG
jgi:RNA polymerase sporulation-specific sigma factor